MNKQLTQLKLGSLIPGFKKTNLILGILSLWFLIPLSYMLFLSIEKSGGFSLAEQILPLQALLVGIFLLAMMFCSLKIFKNVFIQIDSQGIHRFYKNRKQKNFFTKNINASYHWNDIKLLEASKGSRKIKITLKTQKTPIILPLYLWQVEQSSIDLALEPMPWNNIRLLKYDINNAHLVKAIKAWMPYGIDFDVYDQHFSLKNHKNLGIKIKAIAYLSVFLVFIYALSIPASDEIHFYNGYFENKKGVFFIVYALLGIYIMLNELRHKSTKLAAFLVSLLFASTLTAVTGGIFTIYTKYSHKQELVEFTLVEIDEKRMIWECDNPKWSKFRMNYEFDFERDIKIGDKINLKVNKGPYEIYTSSIKNFDLSTQKFKTNTQ